MGLFINIPGAQNVVPGEDYRILEDRTDVNGVRHITAEPSSMVCSKQIDLDIKDGCIHNLSYAGGCHGNLMAIGRLVEGMKVSDVVETLTGVDCHGRGTACTDQLARILKSLK